MAPFRPLVGWGMRGEWSSAHAFSVNLSPNAALAIDAALEEAERGQRRATSDDLLTALLSQTRSSTVLALNALGISPALIYEELARTRPSGDAVDIFKIVQQAARHPGLILQTHGLTSAIWASGVGVGGRLLGVLPLSPAEFSAEAERIAVSEDPTRMTEETIKALRSLRFLLERIQLEGNQPLSRSRRNLSIRLELFEEGLKSILVPPQPTHK